jgi:hypothetical protein
VPHQSKTTNNSKQIILDIGINDSSSNVHTTAGRNQITKQERSNLDAINETMFELESPN